MDIKYLQTFKSIIQTGSFQKAAEKLNYTPSTVTFQIQQLERELAVPLFEKIGRRMVLTQAGMDIMPLAENILQSMERMREYRDADGEITGLLTVAMPETLLVYQMQPLLAQFRCRAPGAALSLKTMNCREVRDSLMNGSVDIGIQYDITSHQDMKISHAAGSYQGILVAEMNSVPTLQAALDEGQKLDTGLIRYRKDSVFQERFDEHMRKKGLEFQYEIELESIEAVKRSVLSRLGIAYLPDFAVEQELKSQKLGRLDAGIPCEHVSAICAYHKNKYVSRPMEAFLRIFEETL